LTQTPSHPPPPLWQWPSLTNLLAPAVACAWLAGLAMVHNLFVPGEYYVLLAALVWLIYTVDGLLDARGSGGTAPVTSPRALFHRARRTPMALLAVLVALGGSWLAWRTVSGTLVIATGVLSLPILLYLFYAQSLRYSSNTLTFIPKEFLAGMLFAMGVMLPLLDLQGQLFLAAPDQLAAAYAEGFLVLLIWVLKVFAFLIARLFHDPATFLIGSLFTTNCLLTALGESDTAVHLDPGSARRTTPYLAKLAPVFAAALLVSSVINIRAHQNPHATPLMFMVAAGAALMLVVHLFRVRRRISGPASATLFDLSLLVPVLLLPVLFPA